MPRFWAALAYQGWGLFRNAACLGNGGRIMLPFGEGLCQQTSLVIVEGRLPGDAGR